MATTNVTWEAQSKDRPKTVFTGKGTGSHKEVLRTVKEKLVKLTTTGGAKLGEQFKVCLKVDGKVVDAWVLKAKPARGSSVKSVTTTKKTAVTKKAVSKK